MDEDLLAQEEIYGADYIRMLRLQRHGYKPESVDMNNPKIKELLINPEVDIESPHVRDILLGRVDESSENTKPFVSERKVSARKKKSLQDAEEGHSGVVSVRRVRISMSNEEYVFVKLLSMYRGQPLGRIVLKLLKESLSESEKERLSFLRLFDK